LSNVTTNARRGPGHKNVLFKKAHSAGSF
jgi:hypothetical protein